MNSSIVPPGYTTIPSRDQIRKRLTEQRAAELSAAAPEVRQRLLMEIEDEVEQQLKQASSRQGFLPHICW